VSEQLAFDELLGNGRTVHLDERAVAPAAHPVDAARHQFLAGAVLAVNQHAAVGRRSHRDLLAQLLHDVALADHGEAAIDVCAQRAVLRLQPPLADGVPDHEHGFLERQRLLDEVERAHLDRAHRRLDVAVPGDHHDRRVDRSLAQPFEGAEPVQTGQPDVEHDRVVRDSRQPFEAGFAALDRLHLITLVAQHAA